jgi:hypothetical protein
MPDLTPELNLNLALDDDDTADYLTVNLSDSLTVLDGMFNASTGHAHNGSHQGGALEFLDLLVGEDLTVVGQTDLKGPALLESNLHVVGTSTLDGAATVGSTLRVTGAVTLDAGLSVGTDLTVTRDLTVGRNQTIAGTLGVTGAVSVTGTLTAGGTIRTSGGQIVAPNSIGGFASRNAANTADATMLWMDGANATVMMAGASNVIRLVNSTNSIQWAHWDAAGNYIQDAGTMYVGGDAVVTLAAAQTLTNKMLTNPRNQASSGFLGANTGDATNFMFNYGNGTFTLPNPSAAWIGVFRAIKSYPGGPSTITCGVAMIGPGGTGPVSSFVIQAGDSVTMWCDGTNWWVL